MVRQGTANPPPPVQIRVSPPKLIGHRSIKRPCRGGEMVDAKDLKSFGCNVCAGSSPALGTKIKNTAFKNAVFFLCLKTAQKTIFVFIWHQKSKTT